MQAVGERPARGSSGLRLGVAEGGARSTREPAEHPPGGPAACDTDRGTRDGFSALLAALGSLATGWLLARSPMGHAGWTPTAAGTAAALVAAPWALWAATGPGIRQHRAALSILALAYLALWSVALTQAFAWPTAAPVALLGATAAAAGAAAARRLRRRRQERRRAPRTQSSGHHAHPRGAEDTDATDATWALVVAAPVVPAIVLSVSERWSEPMDLAVGVLTLACVIALVLARTLRAVNQHLADERELARQSRVDALTGLPNREAVTDHLAESLGDGRPTAVLFCDLDDFKVINDTWGHVVGDELLTVVARRLRACVEPPRRHSTGALGGRLWPDTVARLGGDEFVVALGASGKGPAAARMASRVRAAISRPIDTSSGRLTVTPSIGLAHVDPDEDLDVATLLSRADTAMYAAKARGRGGIAAYEPGLDDEDAAVAGRLAADLRSAVAEGTLDVAYQPIAVLADGSRWGYEALARWEHPRLGSIPPATFVPIAEETGTITPLGQHVLARALRDCAAWRAGAGEPLRVSINVSCLELASDDYADRTLAALREAGLPPHALVLEVTEHRPLETNGPLGANLARLREAGVGIGLDGFGSGWSSLAALHDLPVTALKLAPALVNRATDPAGPAARVVRAVVGLAEAASLEVTAQGIEDEVQQRRVTALGCRLGQGWRLGRPGAVEPL